MKSLIFMMLWALSFSSALCSELKKRKLRDENSYFVKKPRTQKHNIKSIPLNLMPSIASFLDPQEISKFSQTNKDLNSHLRWDSAEGQHLRRNSLFGLKYRAFKDFHYFGNEVNHNPFIYNSSKDFFNNIFISSKDLYISHAHNRLYSGIQKCYQFPETCSNEIMENYAQVLPELEKISANENKNAGINRLSLGLFYFVVWNEVYESTLDFLIENFQGFISENQQSELHNFTSFYSGEETWNDVQTIFESELIEQHGEQKWDLVKILMESTSIEINDKLKNVVEIDFCRYLLDLDPRTAVIHTISSLDLFYLSSAESETFQPIFEKFKDALKSIYGNKDIDTEEMSIYIYERQATLELLPQTIFPLMIQKVLSYGN